LWWYRAERANRQRDFTVEPKKGSSRNRVGEFWGLKSQESCAFPSDFGLRPALPFGIRDGWQDEQNKGGDSGMRIAFLVFDRNQQYAAFSVIRKRGSLSSGVQKTACGCCGRVQMGWYDRKVRRVGDLSCGDTRIFLELEVRRLDCRRCGKVKRERLDFLADNPLYTKRFCLLCRQSLPVGDDQRCGSGTVGGAWTPVQVSDILRRTG
jgi:hypothetical protein